MPVHAGASCCCIQTAPTDRTDAQGAPWRGLRMRGAAAEPPCALPLRSRVQALAPCAHCEQNTALQVAGPRRVAAIAKALCAAGLRSCRRSMPITSKRLSSIAPHVHRLAAHGMKSAPQPRGVPRGCRVRDPLEDRPRRRRHSMAQPPTKSSRDMNHVINVAARQCGVGSKLQLNGAQRRRAYWSQRIWRRSVESRAEPRAPRAAKVTCAWSRLLSAAAGTGQRPRAGEGAHAVCPGGSNV